MASSKSLASKGSIVNVSTSLKSFRLAISSCVISGEIPTASCSTSVGNESGNPYSAKIAFISVLFSPCLPNTSLITPTGFFAPAGQSTILAKALSPFLAPFKSVNGIKISCNILRSSGIKKAKCCDSFKIPVNSIFARLIISTTSPSFLLPLLLA